MTINCSSLSKSVHVSLGMYGRMPHALAIETALSNPPFDSLLGQLSTRRLQICPQNLGRIDREFAASLRVYYPAIEWRLHANVQINQSPKRVDLSDWPKEQDWFSELRDVSVAVQAPVYTAHAGRRDHASVKEVLRYAHEAEQLLGIPVGIEGHYPTKGNYWLFSSWHEYRQLLESGARYALDLSHLHILATSTNQIERTLVQELLNSPQCLEVHLSDNDGTGDQHHPLSQASVPWWWSTLPYLHSDAVIFSEGKQSSSTII